jgi:hypothetical protein
MHADPGKRENTKKTKIQTLNNWARPKRSKDVSYSFFF